MPRAANARAMPRSDLKGKRVRLYSRPDNDLTYRFPLIVEAFSNLRLRSCIMDGEAVSCGPDGIASWIVGHPVENDELGHWYLLCRSVKLSDNRIDKLRDVVNKAAGDYVLVDHHPKSIIYANDRFAPQAVTPASGFLTQVSNWLLAGRPESISLRNP